MKPCPNGLKGCRCHKCDTFDFMLIQKGLSEMGEDFVMWELERAESGRENFLKDAMGVAPVIGELLAELMPSEEWLRVHALRIREYLAKLGIPVRKPFKCEKHGGKCAHRPDADFDEGPSVSSRIMRANRPVVDSAEARRSAIEDSDEEFLAKLGITQKPSKEYEEDDKAA